MAGDYDGVFSGGYPLLVSLGSISDYLGVTLFLMEKFDYISSYPSREAESLPEVLSVPLARLYSVSLMEMLFTFQKEEKEVLGR